MREILFRGKTLTGKWVEGAYYKQEEYYGSKEDADIIIQSKESLSYDQALDYFVVIPETIGQYTELTDKNGKKIFEGDIVQYLNDDDFDCQSVVKFGEYKQDGSGGEYSGRKCIGFYVEVDNFTCPDWCDNEPERFPYHMWQQNVLEVASKCEVIGNIFDNTEILINN